MAAAIGNQYAAKDRRWGRAIDKALENRCKSDGQKALIVLAEQLLIAAENGEGWALKELGDRLDGKPAQSIAVGNEPGESFKVEKIAREVIGSNIKHQDG